MIQFTDVQKTFPNGTSALNGVSFQIEQGEFVFFVGASGAGKSTLIKLMMREQVLTKGSIKINEYDLTKMKNRQIPKFRRTMGVVFQDFRIIPTMNVYDNVAFAMRVIGVKPKYVKKRVPYILDLVELSHKAKNYPNELSGGEQQRVALARALVNNPKMIIADEPTGNIDPRLSVEIMQLLADVNELGTTIVVVTHEKSLVDTMGKRVITLEKGKIISDRVGGYAV